jgi:hypothetical protein
MAIHKKILEWQAAHSSITWIGWGLQFKIIVIPNWRQLRIKTNVPEILEQPECREGCLYAPAKSGITPDRLYCSKCPSIFCIACKSTFVHNKTLNMIYCAHCYTIPPQYINPEKFFPPGPPQINDPTKCPIHQFFLSSPATEDGYYYCSECEYEFGSDDDEDEFDGFDYAEANAYFAKQLAD